MSVTGAIGERIRGAAEGEVLAVATSEAIGATAAHAVARQVAVPAAPDQSCNCIASMSGGHVRVHGQGEHHLRPDAILDCDSFVSGRGRVGHGDVRGRLHRIHLGRILRPFGRVDRADRIRGLPAGSGVAVASSLLAFCPAERSCIDAATAALASSASSANLLSARIFFEL